MNSYQLSSWLPTTKKEVELHKWEQLDVILFSGDAYIDHPSFGTAVVGRHLESLGLRVAIVPQPNWRDDLRDFKKLGVPTLFFAVTAGVMDSMVNKYTANRRIRSEDAYTPDGRSDLRPDYPSLVYTQILKDLFPQVPVVVGGIEASLRRLSHYDYWQDCLKPGILADCKADLLVYGMGEKALSEIVKALQSGQSFEELKSIPQTAYIGESVESKEGDVVLASFEECLRDKKKQSGNFKFIEIESNQLHPQKRLIQQTGSRYIVINPAFPVMTTEEIDRVFDLPYTRMPHPKYKDKRIPAYEMIKHSINLHRGCFGGCSFCTISAHQGKFIVSRSKESILKEVEQVAAMPDFKGYISDLGGPSANMYAMQGVDLSVCAKCKRPSCIYPSVCFNLDTNHKPLLDIYQAADRVKGIKKTFVSSGVRYDLLLAKQRSAAHEQAAKDYTEELIVKHVSGRLKVAPEHTSKQTLACMRKPSFEYFEQFTKQFAAINAKHGLKQQLIPYFISSHPACTEEDMAELAVISKRLHFKLEQVQDFTPTPMTVATEMYYSGVDPYSLKPVFTALSKEDKLNQRQFFFWYDNKYRRGILRSLQRLKRPDLIKKLFG